MRNCRGTISCHEAGVAAIPAPIFGSSTCTAISNYTADNGPILRFWHYGEALRQLGNDDALLCLRQFAKGTDAIHVLTWLEFVADGTREHWREIEKNWE